MAKPRVVLSHPMFPDVIEKALAPHARVAVAPTLTALRRELRTADALVTLLTRRVDATLLRHAPKLKVIGNVAVGVDNIDLRACAERGIRVVNTPGVLTRATAELALTLLLAAARRVPEGERMCRANRYTTWKLDLLLGKELRGRHAVLAGEGRIGRETARLFRGIGLKTEFITREDSENSIRRKLSRAQVLSIHLPLTDRTRHWLDGVRMRYLPGDAIVINTSRGPVVDERALTETLRARRIFAAGLDVYEHEPAIPKALRDLDNVVLLPHVGSATEATRRRMVETAIRGTLAVLNGQRPGNLVKLR